MDNNNNSQNTEKTSISALFKEFRERISSSTTQSYTDLLNELLDRLRCSNEFRKTILDHFTTMLLNWQRDDEYHGHFTQNPTAQQMKDELDYLESLLLQAEAKSKDVPFPLEAALNNFGNMFQYEVFICHAGEQYALASTIYDKLFYAGIRTFLDCKSFHPGQPLQGLFDDFLPLVSRAAVIILSQDFYTSKWTTKELELLKRKANTNPNFVLVVIPTIQSEETVNELKGLYKDRLHVIQNYDDTNKTAETTRKFLQSRVPHNVIPCGKEGCKSLAEVTYWVLNRGQKRIYKRVIACNQHHFVGGQWLEEPKLFSFEEMVDKYKTEEPNVSFTPFHKTVLEPLPCSPFTRENEIPVEESPGRVIELVWKAMSDPKAPRTYYISKWVEENGSEVIPWIIDYLNKLGPMFIFVALWQNTFSQNVDSVISTILQRVGRFCEEQQQAPTLEAALRYLKVPLDMYSLEQKRIAKFHSDFVIIHSPKQQIAEKLETDLKGLGFDVVPFSLDNVHSTAAVVIIFDEFYETLPTDAIKCLQELDRQVKPTVLNQQLVIPLFGPGASIGSKRGKEIEKEFPNVFAIAGVDFRGKGAENETEDRFTKRSLEFLLRLMRCCVPLRYNYWSNRTFKCESCGRRLKHSLEGLLEFDGSGKLPTIKFQAQLVCNNHGTALSSSPITAVDIAFRELAHKAEEALRREINKSH